MASPQMLVGAAALVVFMLLWQFGSQLFVSGRILPAPSEIVDSIWFLLKSPSFFTDHLRATMVEILAGLAMGSAIGFGLGVIVTRSQWLEWIVLPFVVISQVVPKIALAPLFVVWFGFGMTPKIVIAALVSFFPLFVNVILGIRSIDEGKREMMQSICASRRATFFKLELPHTAPYAFTGLKSSIVFSVVGATTAELIGSSEGLGFLMVSGMASYDTPLIFAALTIVTVIGLVLYGAVALLERWTISWHESMWLRDGEAGAT